jgi:4-aminobutyrate aminotransferase-like enzyme
MNGGNEMNSPSEKTVDLTEEQRSVYQRHLMPWYITKDPIHMKSGRGVWFEDINGKKYLDFTTQMFACYLGLGNEEIAEAIYDAAKKYTTVHPHMQTDLRYSLAHKIASIAPKNLNRISFTIGGGPANESAMKIALKNVSGSKNFVSMWGGYHGDTFTAGAATFEATRTQAPYGNSLVLFNYVNNLNNIFVRAPHPYCYRCPIKLNWESCRTACADLLRDIIVNGVVGPLAGIILEPIQSAGGQFPFPKEYLQKARAICDEFGALLIFDEIQTFCRTGKWFAADFYGVEPDVISFGKGMGAGVPVAGIIIHDRLIPFEDMMEDLHTFQNNHIGFAAALKTLEIIERDRLLDNAVMMGQYLQESFRELQKKYTEIDDIRGVGLAIGVELVKDAKTKEPLPREVSDKILERCISKGLFFQITGQSILKIKPALIIKKQEIDIAMEILEESFKQVLRA